ncbi:MAG: nucleotidyltransferase family protein [Rhodospirillales bacterium]|nr:nucleotidyltransferase family protein [Alphaproteobacteria bacterium]MCB9986712.1 nucleotidyltransferase family protein [Rhodospirillales bacterium]USO08518.1 MAG: nucleotidyltransferase family protein [Rhodospirillales bacterium]
MTRITQAMILAAGRGERMRPLTDTCPKPMVPVAGKPIIDYAIESLRALGVETIVANTHHLAQIITPHLDAMGVAAIYEPALLDTGGGIKNALAHLDRDAPLMVLSGDSILPDVDTLPDLADAWDANTMDILLLLQPLETMTLTPGIGDYDLTDGLPRRAPDKSGAYMWTSARILNPRIFDSAPDGPFSFRDLMDAAQTKGRLAARVHKGVWHHLTTPADIAAVERGR